MDATFKYSLIRVVPNLRRGEWVNVGVCVFLGDRLDIHIYQNFTKLRALDPRFDATILTSIAPAWEAVTAACATAEEAQNLLSKDAFIHLSPIGLFVAQPSDYQNAVESILRDLVIPAPLRTDRLFEEKLVTSLRQRFLASDILGREIADIDRHRVVQHYPIDDSAGLYADFAIRNGQLRITETIDFRVSDETIKSSKHGQAAIKAVTLDRAVHKDPRCVPSVVYACHDNQQDLIQSSLTLLTGYAERLYHLNSPSDMAEYMQMMAEAANGLQIGNSEKATGMIS